MLTDELRETKRRASLAAKQAKEERIAALGAVSLRHAAVDRGIDPDMARMWAKAGLSTSAFRGPRNVWCVREREFDQELEQWRCSWPGCTHYALNASRRCHKHAGAIERDGRLTADEFAQRHGLNLGQLLARLQAGEIPAERVERGGRPAAWLIDEAAALQVLEERYRCQAAGCPRYALEPGSSYCHAHSAARNVKAAAAAARKIWQSPRRTAHWVWIRWGHTRAYGIVGGRPTGSTKLETEGAEQLLIERYAADGKSQRWIAGKLGITRAQVRYALRNSHFA